MAQVSSASATPLPPAPSAGAAPGQQPYNHPQGNGTHMPPPPVPPLNIPHNNNDIPSALSAGDAVLSPGGGSVRRAAPEPNKRALYVGGLDPRVTEDVLKKIFETAGHVQSVKIIPDKNAKGYNYGFVEYDDPSSADRAMNSLNGRRVHNNEIKVNWAYQSSTVSKEDTSGHFHIFVGDLSNEVNDEVLLQAFSTFGQVSEARVMWDMKTGRSRGYGFVAYRDRGEAEKALSSMDGEWLGSRAIRCNWANQKGQPSFTQQQQMVSMGMTPTTPFGGHHQFPAQGPQSYDMVVQQTPQWQTTCYVGNLTPYTTQNDLVPLFQNFGYVVETRFQSDRGFAFIKMDAHDNAAQAICGLNGYNVNGRPLKCSWGKDRPPTQQFDFSPASGTPQQGYPPPTPQGYGFPQYGAAPSMSPAGPSPGGHFNQPSPGYPHQQPYGGMGPSPGGYGRGGQAPQNYMGQPQASPYGGYNGGYQG
ncbi:hypothetical protein K461DRAFT_219666 [Myriangium duriaei CBS 260.36]|uniref:RRM domain-containing protein n=1 Tax=Myriangium duriaei CBS 260.36 TaxID=1168546 RepID=A0A9P4J9L2_9PEZI|nr:hypothetical protein K461DRAFT_219666 [Myriangium duriaei CBS 260.36]